LNNRSFGLIFSENQVVLDFIRHSPLFAGMSDSLLAQLEPLCDYLEIEKGQKILTEGEPNNNLFFLIEGVLKVTIEGEMVRYLDQSGSLVGEMSVISDAPAIASVEAVTTCRLLSVRSKEFSQFESADKSEIRQSLYFIFAVILTEKLKVTSLKAVQFEKTNRLLEQTTLDLEAEALARRVADEQAKVYAKFMEASGQGLGIFGLDLFPQYLNPALRAMLGVEDSSPREPVNWLLRYDNKTRSRFALELIPQLFETGQWSGELDLVKPDGQRLPTLENIFIINGEEGHPRLIAAVITDITARKQMENQLRLNEASMNVAQQIAHLGSWELELSSGKLSWSDEVFRIFGQTQEHFLPDYNSFMAGIHAEDRGEVMAALNFAAQTQTLLSIEHRVVQPNGAERVVQERGEVFSNRFGEPQKMVGTMLDITESKRIQKQLLDYKDGLEVMVAKRTEELTLATKEAERANQAKSDFLANISHELRTPLHGILSFAEKGIRKSTQLSPEKLQRYFEVIEGSGQRLLRLLDNLLDLSKLEAGKMDFAFAEGDLVDLVWQIHQEMEGMILDKNIQFVLDPPPNHTWGFFDPCRIGQVLSNLFSNAIKFSDPGKTLRVRIIDEELEGKPAFRLDVLDQGIGIPETELEGIFDKFAQSSKTDQKAGGTGLGLAICREIIEGHQGKIWAEIWPEGGTKMTILFPKRHVTPA